MSPYASARASTGMPSNVTFRNSSPGPKPSILNDTSMGRRYSKSSEVWAKSSLLVEYSLPTTTW